jgi:hypothetical protein
VAKLRPVAVKDLSLADVAAERARRAGGLKLVDFSDGDAFPKQTAFLRDPSRFKLALCTRRAGKTEAAAIDLLEVAQNQPGSVGIFFGRTRMSAKNVIWRILRRRIERHHLTCSINKTELSIEFPNGSLIFLAGVDATTDERDKYLGMPLSRVYIDECASHRQDLTDLVCGVLMPALVDYDGTLVLLGTPGNFTKGLFFRLSIGRPLPEDPLCSVHKWTAYDNPSLVKVNGKMRRICDLWKAEIEKIGRETPMRLLTPLYKQHYEGVWVIDDAKRVYFFDDALNTYDKVPKDKEWTYVLGVDMGYEDDSAFVIHAFSKLDPILYTIYSYKEKKMDITAVAEHIKSKILSKWPIDVIVVDGSAKQAVQEIIKRHGLEMIASDKKDKDKFIALLDAELRQGLVKLQKDACLPLIDEMCGLIWADPKPGSVVRKEHPGCDNHACDAFYYGWRYTFSYLGRNPEPEVVAGSPKWLAMQANALLDDAKKQHAKQAIMKAADDWGVAPKAPTRLEQAMEEASGGYNDWGVPQSFFDG